MQIVTGVSEIVSAINLNYTWIFDSPALLIIRFWRKNRLGSYPEM
jgi:hypothetical protein